MTDTIPVVAAVIERDGRYLVGRRPANKRHGGLWEFPGGKVDAGEDVSDAVRRELSEELALDLQAVGNLLFEARDPGSPFVIRFYPVAAGGEPGAREHREIAWVTAGDLARLRLAPSDRAFVQEMLGRER